MATFVPAKRATEFIFYVSLVSQADTKLFQNNPTIAAGDFLVSTDGSTTTDLDTLPVVTPASSDSVKITVSVAEMTGDNVKIVASDAAGAQWCDQSWNIQTAVRQIDDLAFPSVSGRNFVVETDGMVHVDVKEWLGVAPLALIAQRVAVDVQAGLAALATVCTEARLSELDEATGGKMANQMDLVKTEADKLTLVDAGAGVSGSVIEEVENRATPAEVLTQVNAALDTAISELTQGIPAITPTLRTGIMLLYMALRDRLDTNTSGTDELAIYNDAGTKIAKKLITDDGSDYSEAKMISGV